MITSWLTKILIFLLIANIFFTALSWLDWQDKVEIVGREEYTPEEVQAFILLALCFVWSSILAISYKIDNIGNKKAK